MGLIDWARRRIEANDAAVVDSLRARAAAQMEAAAAAQAAKVADLPSAYAARTPESVAATLAQELGRRPGPEEDPAVVAARQTLLNILYGGDSGTPSPPRSAMRTDGNVKHIVSELGDWSAGGNSANVARNEMIAQQLAQLQASRAGGFQRGMARLNEHIASNPWARAGAYSGMVGGSLAGVAGVTPAAMELLRMAGLVGPDDEGQPMG